MSDPEVLVPDAITHATPADVYGAMREASRVVLGTPLARSSLLVLLAQWAEETGRGAAMHRWNIGNIKHVPGDGHSYCQFRCDEVIGGKVVWLDPPNPGCSFRAYVTLEAGVLDYLTLLHKRFAGAWPDVVAGQPADFARDLKAQHYYTADVTLYTRALVALYEEFDRTIPPDELTPSIPTDNAALDVAVAERIARGPFVDDEAPEPPPDA